MVHVIKRGLDIPLVGEPEQRIVDGPPIGSVALLGDDYVGMRPTLLVHEGDMVRLGQPVFEDKKTPGVIYTAPGAGRVTNIHRGPKRRFLSLIIQLEGDEQETFERHESLGSLAREQVRQNLVHSGLWTCFRTRPYSRTPWPDAEPHSIFVTAIDTNPLAADPPRVIAEYREWFVAGLRIVGQLTEGPVFVCTRPGADVPGRDIPGMRFEEFAGPHPAGLVGTHIHLLDPVGAKKSVWHVGYQDVIAMGHLFTTGRLMTERIVALGGPHCQRPALYRTRLGANLNDLVAGNVKPVEAHRWEDQSPEVRIISGSALCGRAGLEPVDYLGRFHNQVTMLQEGTRREFLGWQKPGANRFSVTRAFLGSWLPGRRFDLSTNLNGGHRSMVPIGTYERVMPLDILPTQLLRALIVADTEEAQALGALELDEEDLGLCTFVCPGKYNYGVILRDNLTQIEKEG